MTLRVGYLVVTCLLGAAVLPGAARAQTGTAAEVVAVEAAFAARVREAGVKAGFLEFLAPDGVVFRPGPVNGPDYLAERPASAGLLSWRPALADLSAAGDLGYSSGQYEARAAADGPVAGTGWYLSVWRRQPSGRLGLVADHGLAAGAGADTAAAHAAVSDTTATALWPASQPSPAPAPDLQALDRSGPAPVHERVRTLAAGALHAGAAARTALFQAGSPALSPLGGGVAVSRDLGYTYGAYDWAQERGYYLRVWRRAGERWVVVAEVYSPAR